MYNWTENSSSDEAVNAAAQAQKIPFDYDVHVSHVITLDDGRYYVVRYENYLPFVSGVEIFDRTGGKITDGNRAESVLKAVAWTESVGSLNDSDIGSLASILNDSRNIASAAVPMSSLSNSLIDTFNMRRSLNQFGITNELVVSLVLGAAGETNVQYEAAVMIVNDLNNRLGEFSNATSTVNDRLPGLIAQSTAIKNGTAVADEGFQSDVIETAEGLGVMQDQISGVQNALNGISGIGDWLTMIEKLAADLLINIPVYGDTLRGYADYLLVILGDYQDNVFNLKGYAKNLQDTVGAEKDQLDRLIAESDQRTDDLTGSWNARQTATIKVVLYLIIPLVLVIVLIAVAAVALMGRKKRQS